MARPEQWRVRVKSCIETWVEVAAHSAAEAEAEAVNVPGVISVFPKSATSARQVVVRDPIAGVEEE